MISEADFYKSTLFTNFQLFTKIILFCCKKLYSTKSFMYFFKQKPTGSLHNLRFSRSATLKCYLLSFLSHSLGALMKSQFPVFTIYAQKVCLKQQQPCDRAWSVERVQGYAFSLQNHIKRKTTAKTRQECYEMCFGETDFLCR